MSDRILVRSHTHTHTQTHTHARTPRPTDQVPAFWCFAGWLSKMGAIHAFSDDDVMYRDVRTVVALLDPGLFAHFVAEDCTHMFFTKRWLALYFKREVCLGVVVGERGDVGNSAACDEVGGMGWGTWPP